MGIIADLKDEFQALARERLAWETHWREIASYVLPNVETYDRLLQGNGFGGMSAVVTTPVAARRSQQLYDMTSLWGIERLSAGIMSLKTPESQFFHELGTDSLFGEEQTHEEKVATERLNGYLFKVRANPRSGFWNAHRAAIKSMAAFGNGWMLTTETEGRDGKVPFEYSWTPNSELFPGVGPNGQPNRMFRVFARSFDQIVKQFGVDNVPGHIVEKANDPNQKHNRVKVMHAIRPRSEDSDRNRPGVRGAAFQSWYCLPDDNALIGGESGFYEMPFSRYSWTNTGNSAWCEGPIALCLGEIRSMNEMSKNELISSQTMLRPAYGVAGKNVRLNLNPGVANPGLVTGDGKPLFAPLNTGARPDFAAAVLERRRKDLREMLYLPVWNIMMDDREQTATESMIRAQEKGDLFGPVGISLSEGLSYMVDREIGILGRKGAFNDGSPLALPDSLADKNLSPTFNSPLDRLRRMAEVVGMTRLLEFVQALENVRPGTAERLDVDEMLDTAQEVLGAPAKTLRPKDEAQAGRAQQGNVMQTAQMLQMLKGAGDAGTALGNAGQAMSQGAEMAAQSPATQGLLQRTPQVLEQAAQQ